MNLHAGKEKGWELLLWQKSIMYDLEKSPFPVDVTLSPKHQPMVGAVSAI